MYTVTLCAHYFMGIWRVEGVIHALTDTGRSEVVGAFSEDYDLGPESDNRDELTNTLRAIREWAESTILE